MDLFSKRQPFCTSSGSYALWFKGNSVLFSSSIIGAGSTDIGVFSGLLFLFVGFLVLRMRRLTLYLSDPVMAAAVGANIFLWSAAIAISLGLAGFGDSFIWHAIHIWLLNPSCTNGKGAMQRYSGMFLVSPIMALICVVLGLMLGNSIDLPPAQNNCRLNVRSFTFGLALEMALRLYFFNIFLA